MRGDRGQSRGYEASLDVDRLRRGLALLVGWSAPRFVEFLDKAGPLDRWWSEASPDWDDDRWGFLTAGQRRQLAELRKEDAEDLARCVDEWSGQVIGYGEEAYPSALDDLSKPPAALHVVGDAGLLDEPSLAVVGSRDIGVSASSSVRRILQPIARRGLVIVSGGALGADAVAHRAAVAAGGSTVVVLPAGLRRPSPKSNRRLFRDVVGAGGLLVSEYPPDSGVRRYHFQRRNSLIAAMSRGVLVLRAGENSGTQLTVDAARRLERPLGAVPGAPDDPLSKGCHEILRRGGRLVARRQDLVDWWATLAPEQNLVPEDDDESGGDGGEADTGDWDCEVLECAAELVESDGAFGLEALARETGKSASELQTVILGHELSGIVERAAGGGRFRFVDR